MASVDESALSLQGRHTETGSPLEWEPLADEVLDVFRGRCGDLVRKAADDFYGDLLGTVEDYLADNAKFNLAERISSAERGRRSEWERAESLQRQVEGLKSTLRLIAGQNPAPSNSPDSTHENYLRRVLIDLAARALSTGEP